MSSRSTVHSTKFGEVVKLINSNYHVWKDTIEVVLLAMGALSIVTDEEERPIDNNAAARTAQADHDKRAAKALALIQLSCSSSIQPHVRGIRLPLEMWRILERRLGQTAHKVGRQAIVRIFHSERRARHEPLSDYFAQLAEYRDKLEGTPEAMLDNQFITHVFTTLPDDFAMAIKVLQGRDNQSIDDVMDHLIENDETARFTKWAKEAFVDVNISTTSGNALYSEGKRNGNSGKYHCSRASGHFNNTAPGCTRCKMNNHTTANCRALSSRITKRNSNHCNYCRRTGHTLNNCTLRPDPRYTQAQGQKFTGTCFRCGGSGHQQRECPSAKDTNGAVVRYTVRWSSKATASLAIGKDADTY
jgi:hypothetical protein